MDSGISQSRLAHDWHMTSHEPGMHQSRQGGATARARRIFCKMKIFKFRWAKYCCRLSSILDSAIIKTQTQILAMEVSAVCGTPPRTPPREELDGANPNADEVQQEEEDEEQEEDEEEEEPERQKKIRGRRKWEVLQSWDRNALLDSEINAEVLRIATEKMEESGLVEWPSARSAAKTLGLWTLSLIPTPANPAALK